MPPYSPELNPVENAWQYLRQNFLSNRENYETIPTRRNGLTKTGDTEARRVMVEAAWTYRLLARVGRILLDRLEGLPVEIRDIAWKAQVRLCARYRRLAAKGKPLPLVVAAIARELAGFAWAIARQVAAAKTA